jgi:hypothetical protein
LWYRINYKVNSNLKSTDWQCELQWRRGRGVYLYLNFWNIYFNFDVY